jgi:hypothetical protein
MARRTLLQRTTEVFQRFGTFARCAAFKTFTSLASAASMGRIPFLPTHSNGGHGAFSTCPTCAFPVAFNCRPCRRYCVTLQWTVSSTALSTGPPTGSRAVLASASTVRCGPTRGKGIVRVVVAFGAAAPLSQTCGVRRRPLEQMHWALAPSRSACLTARMVCLLCPLVCISPHYDVGWECPSAFGCLAISLFCFVFCVWCESSNEGMVCLSFFILQTSVFLSF